MLASANSIALSCSFCKHASRETSLKALARAASVVFSASLASSIPRAALNHLYPSTRWPCHSQYGRRAEARRRETSTASCPVLSTVPGDAVSFSTAFLVTRVSLTMPYVEHSILPMIVLAETLARRSDHHRAQRKLSRSSTNRVRHIICCEPLNSISAVSATPR